MDRSLRNIGDLEPGGPPVLPREKRGVPVPVRAQAVWVPGLAGVVR